MTNKRKLILITYDQSNGTHYRRELLDFFGDAVDIEIHTICEGLGNGLSGDAVLTLSPISNNRLTPHLKEEIEIIHGSKVLTKAAYQRLMDLPMGTRAFLITTNKTASFDMATYLYQIGVNHIDFVPFYPGCTSDPTLDIAITPGQTRFIPEHVRQVVDLGWRRISLDTFMSLMVVLRLKNEAQIERLYHLSRDIMSHDFLTTPLDNVSRLKDMLSMMIDEIEDGILFLSNAGRPIFENNAFHSMLNLDPGLRQSPDLLNYLPEELTRQMSGPEAFDHKIIHIAATGQAFTLSKRSFYYYNNHSGFLIVLKDVQNIEKLEQKIRLDSVKKKYTAKYTFSDILGDSRAMSECIRHARRMAATDYPVLITGETGTGKELFAHSIHNASSRCEKPFIAINCASLSRDLLESELFGYEEGSFTGAKKGGKKGLFEFAHTGTIFLDEIGDMPFDLQAQLLRVLQEKEIRRVGSTSTIPVDVRIIAATNRDLKQMMEENLFRMDLYYRIGMFSLHLPPLRERPGDIPLLAAAILSQVPGSHPMSQELLKTLAAQTWRGNIRELKNCVEYMAYMTDGPLSSRDLPSGYVPGPEPGPAREVPPIFQELPLRSRKLCFSILNALRERPMGRTRLMEALGNSFTEYEVRTMLEYLTGEGCLLPRRGRGGTALSPEGNRIVLEYLNSGKNG